MGLDIRVYAKVTLIKAVTKEKYDGAEPDDATFLYNEGHDRGDGLVDGVYRTAGDSYGFRAGSYSGYNEWRAMLARLVGSTDRAMWHGYDSPSIRALPFYELIAFSDCEGFIGPKTSAKLAADFDAQAENAARFAKTIEDGDYWLEKYELWRKAFHLAAGEGVVKFH